MQDDDIETVPVFVEGEIQDCINSGVPGDETTLGIDSFIESGLGYAELQVLNDFLKANQCSESAQWCAIQVFESGNVLDLEDCSENSSEDDKIDATELTGKEKCLHSKLTSKGNNYVKDLLKNFQEESEFDIHISSKPNVYKQDGSEVNGLTSYRNGSKNIFIEINSNLAKSRISLGVVRTILHEYIHADMYRKLKSKQLLNLEEMNFKLVYEHFKDENFDKVQAQHETMAELYVKEMAKALGDFHKKAMTPDYNNFITYYGTHPNSTFYEALAWRGLKDSNVQAWQDLTPEEKQAIDTESAKLNMLTINCNDE